MMYFSDDKQADIIDAFNTTSRYLDDILNINSVYFDNMVSQIYPFELQLNKANASDTKAAFLDLHLSISNDIVSTKIYDKRDDFYFEIVNFTFLDGNVPRSTSYGVNISQLIQFAGASSHVADFKTHNKLLTQKYLKQGYRYHKLHKTFSKFYRRYYDLVSKIVSEYDQKIPQSQTADNPVAPRGRATQPSQDTRKTNLAKQPAISSPSR